ncbi:galactose-1-phosphate uridylyltransferase [Ornithinicoccus halotolerans]|uniref:galactose-1-phosphate uridylyltransferase n=1 Tax=Ornithinicoccus halotolerans TaxID=1748220 RepID=UPI0012966BD5|nr:galactose-1-phosphate uridylyltransferase [Ornithinicoccus halotolerans]
MTRRTRTTLADGRELFYFDRPGAAPRKQADLTDPRPPDPVVPTSQMRQDPLTGDWVAMASHRMSRTHLPPADQCPLCPARPGRAPGEIPATDYDVAVFENRFPSFAGPVAAAEPLDEQPLWPVAPAGGRCEVVCFTSDHSASLGALPPDRIRTVVDAWADRTAALSELPAVAQVYVFENRGEAIGVTLHHPHGQIYGYPFLPPRTEAYLRRARAHRERSGGHLLRDVLDAELAAGHRVVLQTAHWAGYVPAAARWPIEVHLAPLRDVPDLAALTDAERDDLARAYGQLLLQVDRYHPGVEGLPYVSGWHQAPTGAGRELGRLYLQLFSVQRAPGKLKYLAGSESGMAAWVNDTTPEAVAARLREVSG